MKKQPPYDPDAFCPKCGHPVVGTIHVRHPYIYEWESLRRTCQRCQYIWEEAVVSPDPWDAPDEEPPVNYPVDDPDERNC